MFRITLEEFEGPLDLLLFFIKRDELDIYNIPLSRITGEFITYITAMHSLDLEVAAEFIYMASLLMSIKARMLLPRQTADSDDGSEFDPRTELVQRLLEYKRIKEGAAELRIIGAERENMFPLGYTEPPEPETIDEMDQPLNRPTLYHLITAYQSVLDQMPKTRTQNISDAPVTVEQQSQLIYSRLREKVQVSFRSLLEESGERIVLVVTFLAVLEMCRNRKILVITKDGHDDFWISRKDSPD